MTTKQIGKRIRRLRKAQHKTLLQVAEESGLSVGFLSQVERNLSGITLSSLVNVARALDVPLQELVDQPAQTAPDSHQGRREVYAIEDESVGYERLSTVFPGSRLHSVKMIVPAGFASETVSHAGEEMVYVLSGAIVYTVGAREYRLDSGDSLHFDAGTPHKIENRDRQQAEVLWVGTLAIFDDAQASAREPADLAGTEFHEIGAE
ncbi:MAG TPA: XRE family transcriptional regulator [Paucimonas sp.]|nr:XRE family transcriptional regulator [Paucimonas sp.]